MPFVEVNREDEAKKLQALMNADPEVKKHIEEWNEEYEFRKKLVLARKTTGLTQKEVEHISGLDQRVISRMETETPTSPSIKTIIKYLSALGYKLDIVKTAQ